MAILLSVLSHGTAEGKKLARDELMSLAGKLDARIAEAELEIPPKPSESAEAVLLSEGMARNLLRQAVETWRALMEAEGVNGEINGYDMVDWYCQFYEDAVTVLEEGRRDMVEDVAKRAMLLLGAMNDDYPFSDDLYRDSVDDEPKAIGDLRGYVTEARSILGDVQ